MSSLLLSLAQVIPYLNVNRNTILNKFYDARIYPIVHYFQHYAWHLFILCILNGVSYFFIQESKIFAHRILGIADQFVMFVNKTIQEELGRCKPVHNFYQSVLINTLCGSVVDSLVSGLAGIASKKIFIGI